MYSTTPYATTRVFKPLILFHDYEYAKPTGEVVHSVIEAGDPHYDVYIRDKKREVRRMLEDKASFWADIARASKDIETRRIAVAEYSHPSPCSSRTASPSPRLSISEPTSPYIVQTPPSPSREASKPTKRRRGNLPKSVTMVLKTWLVKHVKHPYPTEEEKHALAKETKLTMNQISNWFINARRRILQPLLESSNIANSQQELDIYPYEASENSAEDPNSDNDMGNSLKRPASGAVRVKKPYKRRRSSAISIA